MTNGRTFSLVLAFCFLADCLSENLPHSVLSIRCVRQPRPSRRVLNRESARSSNVVFEEFHGSEEPNYICLEFYGANCNRGNILSRNI